MARQVRSICERRNRCGYATNILWWNLWSYIWNNSHYGVHLLISKISLILLFSSSFFGGFDIVRNITLFHFQNYWLSYVHKQLTGQIVLNVTTVNTKYDNDFYLKRLWNFFQARMHKNYSQKVRVYAHCTKTR